MAGVRDPSNESLLIVYKRHSKFHSQSRMSLELNRQEVLYLPTVASAVHTMPRRE
jgi:hypothetical protein